MSDGFSVGVFFIWLAVIVFMGIGWILNLVKIFSSDSSLELLIRIIGLFLAPVGALMGWFF